jgi:hypothetical protein
VAGFCLPADDRIRKKIVALVDDGVCSVSEMRRHILHYVRTDLFAGCEMPSQTDRRFFPTATDYRNCIYTARKAKLQSKLDQVNLQLKIAAWKEKFPNDLFFYRQHTESDGQVDDISVDGTESVCVDDDEDVLLNSSSHAADLLFCHQTEWQRRLLMRYGNDICLLDATYRTSRFALPLFFLCVKTNVNYTVVASFIVECETTAAVSEALQVIQRWNPGWKPQTWMVDFSEVEINALECVFPG